MIKCNLPVLLAERGLKITKLSNDTGISRTTLTSLSNNYSQGIQFDTLNKICNYLKITPGELFLYVPFEINFNFQYGNIFTISVIDGNQKFECDFLYSIDKRKAQVFNYKKEFLGYSPSWTFELSGLESLDVEDKKEDEKAKQKIWEYLKKLPFPLYKILENEILEKINDIISTQQEESIESGEWTVDDIEGMSVYIDFTLEEIFNN